MLVTSIYGMLDDSLLDRVDGELDNDNEYTTWTEYRLKADLPEHGGKAGELVHRGVHVRLKQGVSIFGESGKFK